MQIETGLLLGLMVGYGVIYSLKRIFNIIDYNIKENSKITTMVNTLPDTFTEEEKQQIEEESKQVLDDLDKTLEMSPLWK